MQRTIRTITQDVTFFQTLSEDSALNEIKCYQRLKEIDENNEWKNPNYYDIGDAAQHMGKKWRNLLTYFGRSYQWYRSMRDILGLQATPEVDWNGRQLLIMFGRENMATYLNCSVEERPKLYAAACICPGATFNYLLHKINPDRVLHKDTTVKMLREKLANSEARNRQYLATIKELNTQIKALEKELSSAQTEATMSEDNYKGATSEFGALGLRYNILHKKGVSTQPAELSAAK